jgi:NADH:ubiquinone oxidoreductase subunit F (NADH-binding)
MTGYVTVPAGYSHDIAVLHGPRLLSGIEAGPALAMHRRIWSEPLRLTSRQLLALVEHSGILGRGGAGFPFGRKVATALHSGRRRELVVNASEGEPGSAKDSALMTAAPHLVLDGAELVAGGLGVRTIRVVVPGERAGVRYSVERAIAERDGFRYELHQTSGGFVGGQARATLELLEGRENLPVTAWQPEAVAGLKGRPTLLSNAETYAQVAALAQFGPQGYAQLGTEAEPGTTLLSVAADGPGGVVIEAPHGVLLCEVLQHCGYDPQMPVLVGGYHGTWLGPEQVLSARLTRADLDAIGACLGAGVLLPLDGNGCPVVLTARIVEYLAGQSARRCGPCKNGLPAMADAALLLAAGAGERAGARMLDLVSMVQGRGACAHPDGTGRLVRSLFRAFPGEVAMHERGRCAVAAGVPAR